MANGRLDGPGLVDESVFQYFDRLDKVVIAEIERMNQLEAATRTALGGSAVGSGADKLAESVKKSNSALTEQEKVLREINRLKERNTQVSSDSLRQLTEERAKRSQITKALKDEVEASGTLGRAYSSLRKQRDLAANTLRDMIVNQKSSNREIRNATRDFNALNNKVKQADRAIGNFRDNVGNYGSAVQRVLGFSRELAGAFGVFSAIQIGQEIFEQVKALDALNFGLKEVTDTQENFIRAQEFLDRVADRAGASLITLSKRYVNFLAAAKTTNLGLAETERVFEAVVVAGGVLGRSTDDTNGALRALEQILSKGKVQAEELRGQLGERLPGAFQILEKALGLANGELNELLEVGGLLSVDALPALSQGLEDTFDLDTIDRVETLAASQERLSTEFTRFIRDMETGNGILGAFAKNTLDFLSLAIKGFSLLTKNQEEANAFFSDLAVQESFTDTLRSIQEEAAKTGQSIEEVARSLQSDFTEQLNLAEAQVASLQKELAENPSLLESITIKGELDLAIAKLNLYQGGLKAVIQTLKNASQETETVDEASKSYADTLTGLRTKLKDLRTARDETDYKQDADDINRLNREIKETETLIKKLTDSLKKQKKEPFIAEDSIALAKKIVSEFEKARDEVTVGGEAWVMYAAQAKEAKTALKDLEDQAAILGGDLSSIVSDEDLDFANSVDEFLNNQGLDVVLADFASRMKLSKEEILEEFIDLYGRDLDKFKEYEEEKLKILKLVEREKVAVRQRTLDLADDLSSSFLELQLNRLDEELEKQNSIFQSVADSKTVSEEQIAAAEKKRDENEQRITKEKQKRENQAFLFRQALSVADIFIADGVARANAVASTAAIVPYLPLGASTLATLQALITTNTALAVGSVLAQSIPKLFFKGKALGDDYEGEGIWGELRREVLVNQAGGVTISPDGATPIDVKSTDLIHESMGAFVNSLKSNSVTAQRIRKGAKRTSDQNLTILSGGREVQKNFDEELLIKTIRRAFSKAKVFANFSINNGSVVRRVP